VTGAETKIPINRLLQYADTALPYEVFKKFDFSEKQLPEILKLAQASPEAICKAAPAGLSNTGSGLSSHRFANNLSSNGCYRKGKQKVALPDGEIALENIGK
jgi:hypothetical protein